MKKTVRVCDGCGEELHEGFWYTCDVCGKEYCDICIGQPVFCPEHYQKVQEFIEGLKEPDRVYISPWINMSAQGEVDEIWVSGVKFVPEEPKESEWIVFKAGGEYRVNHSGTDCAGWASDRGSCRFIQLVPGAANALYEHIRRERGHS